MHHVDRAGWMLFFVSAVLFGWSGVSSGDPYVVAGSAVFGAACVLFLLPSRAGRDRDDG